MCVKVISSRIIAHLRQVETQKGDKELFIRNMVQVTSVSELVALGFILS